MGIKVYAEHQGTYTVHVDGRIAGRIINRDKRGRWIFRAAGPDPANPQGPLKGANLLDVTSVLHRPEDLADSLYAGEVINRRQKPRC